MKRNGILSMLLFFGITTAIVTTLVYVGITMHAKQTGYNGYLYSLPALGQSMRDEHMRAEAQRYKEAMWYDEDNRLPHENYAEWPVGIEDTQTSIVSIQWEQLSWKKGNELRWQDVRVILNYSDKITIGDLPGYARGNDYEINNIKRKIDESTIRTNAERSSLGLPLIPIYESNDEISLSEKSRSIEWLLESPQNTIIIVLMGLMLILFRKNMAIILDSYSSKSTFIRYRPQKGGMKTSEDIGGLPHIHEHIKTFMTVAAYPKIMDLFGGRLLPGALLSGPPGTGKSLTAAVLANVAYDLGFAIYKVESSRLMDIATASAPNKIRHGFRRARRNHRSMIIFDEVEAFARTRQKTQSGHEEEKSDALVQLLTEMEGVVSPGLGSIVVVLISNRPELIDEALLRSGRVGLHLEFTPPQTKEARKEILLIHSRDNMRFPKDKKDQWLDIIAEKTEGFTGADLKQLLEDAGNTAGIPHAQMCYSRQAPDTEGSIPPDAHLELEHLMSAKEALMQKIKQKK